MEKQGKDFHDKLAKALYKHVFCCWPEMKNYWDQLEEPLRKMSDKFAKETFDWFNYVHSLEFNKTEVKTPLKVPKPKTKKDSEKELQELIDSITISNTDIEYLKEIHWEDFRHEQAGDKFVHGAYQIVKEMLTGFYLDDLLKWEGKYLRVLDGDLYYFVADEFTQAYYQLESEIIQDTNDG